MVVYTREHSARYMRGPCATLAFCIQIKPTRLGRHSNRKHVQTPQHLEKTQEMSNNAC